MSHIVVEKFDIEQGQEKWWKNSQILKWHSIINIVL